MHFCIPFVSWLSSVYWTILKMCHLCFLKQKWSRENSLSGTLYQNTGNCMFLLSYQLYILAHSGVIDQNLIQFLARLFERKKSRAIVVTPASASASGSVKFFVRVHFSKTIKGIHLKLGILVHYQKRNQLQQGRWPCDLYIQSYLPLFQHST